MGGVGRPNINDSEKDLKGTLRPDRAVVVSDSDLFILPDSPKHLNRTAKKVWKDVGTRLVEKNLLTSLDLPAFERYCVCSAMIIDNLEEFISDDTEPQSFYKYTTVIKFMESFESKFGMSPDSRRKLGFSNKPKGKSKLMNMIASKKAV